MRKLVLAAALASATAPALAGTGAEPQMDVTVISQSAATSLEQAWLVPTIFVGMLLLVMASMETGPISCLASAC